MPLINFQRRWADPVEIGARHATGVYMSIGSTLPKRTTIHQPQWAGGYTLAREVLEVEACWATGA